MNKIFIDLGGHGGQTVNQFYTDILDANNWIIYSFEPLEFDILVAGTKKYNNVHCIKSVAGCVSRKTVIYPTKRSHGEGNTTLSGKITGRVVYKNGINVDEIDFIQWFKEHIQPGDFVVVKMNIEGGEYNLMPGLPEIMPQIAGLYIRLHHNKFKDDQKSKMLQIYNDFKLNIQKFKTFVFCEIYGKKYKFQWLLQEIEKGSKSICE